MTAPERNAVTSPWFRLLLAPAAVLELACVAVFMPKNPQSPLKKPPVRNATGTKGFWIPRNARTTKMRNRMANTTETVLYCRLR